MKLPNGYAAAWWAKNFEDIRTINTPTVFEGLK